MATVAQCGLFPPIIDAWLPAVDITTLSSSNPSASIDISFNYSPYNDLLDIKEVQVSIVRQSDYQSIFKDNPYKRGIYIIELDNTPTDVNATISIPLTAINTKKLGYNELYKVQIRLSNIRRTEQDTDPDTSGVQMPSITDYLTEEEYLLHFSEWSTVGAFSIVAPMSLVMDGNGSQLQNSLTASSLRLSWTNDKTSISQSAMARILGHYYDNSQISYFRVVSNSSDYITEWELKIYENILENNSNRKGELLFSSGILAMNSEEDYNHANYNVPFYFVSNNKYWLELTVNTANLYSKTIDQLINVVYDASSWADAGNALDEVTGLDSVIGKVNITFMPRVETPGTTPTYRTVPKGTILIRRGSDQDNFQFWDTMWTADIETGEVTAAAPLTFDDFTIESGILYRYEITFTPFGTTTNYTITSDPVISIFDNAFLLGQGKQLTVKFNPNISSYRINTSDNVVTTIGSQYPYVTRSTENYYRTFSLSGIIAYEMDSEHQFTSRTDIYGDYIDVYGSYLVNHFYNQGNDRLTQRKFREKVLNYLCDDMPKLFRSTPEGNILVKLTDVNFSPNNQLGRMIGEFTCTATEIGEPSIDNLVLYKIHDNEK